MIFDSEIYNKHLRDAVFYYFNKRSNYARRDGHHARQRFFERYGKKLTESYYELINIKILLGDYKLIASEDDTSALYEGNFKGTEFLAIFNPYEGMVVTFLEFDMVPSFMSRETAKIHTFNSDTIKTSPDLIRLSNRFKNDEMKESTLVYFDRDINLSIYKNIKNEFILYDHYEDLILRKAYQRVTLDEYIELNY